MIIGRSKIGPISQKQRKSHFYWLIDLSTISPSGWKNLAFIERLLKDHWEIDEIIERSLRDHWRSLRDCFGLSQNFEETVATVEITGRSLTDH